MSELTPNSAKPKLVRAKIRRLYVPNALYFITGVTKDRQNLFADSAQIDLLRATIRTAKTYHPFTMWAYAFMRDHFHLLIFVPASTNISKLLQSIQRNFTVNYKKEQNLNQRLRLWQRGFWDHVIRDEHDFNNHFHYIHYNPVKHGYVTRPVDYPHTSFHSYVKRGWYESDWGESEPEIIQELDFE